jgi:hypothetical protein
VFFFGLDTFLEGFVFGGVFLICLYFGLECLFLGFGQFVLRGGGVGKAQAYQGEAISFHKR